jgi:outer membrane protein assembly factor BamB
VRCIGRRSSFQIATSSLRRHSNGGPSRSLRLGAAALAVVALAALTGFGSARKTGAADWPLPNLDLASTRALKESPIDRGNVGKLHVAWRFRFEIRPAESGVFTATPVVAGGLVFVQDMKSNVFALDLETGKLRWRRSFGYTNPGPNGLAVVGGRVYGATDTTVFALTADSGRLLWTQRLVGPTAQFVDVAPQVAHGAVYMSTIGLPRNGRGVLYAIDARTGKVSWKLSTIKGRWAIPSEAGGGGAWFPPSVDGHDVYWGTANPYPYGGTRRHPNGAAYAGRALYTDSLLAVDARTGALSWHDQVTAHDVRDHDFQLSPILGSIRGRPAIFGSGKGGIVIAWDRATHRRIWQTRVGVHRNDSGPLPAHRVSVCPGLLGGVETPMAYTEGRLFLPVIDLCTRASAYGYEPLDRVDVGRGTSEVVALDATTGKPVWTRRLRQPDFGCATAADGVLFTSTFDGTVYALDTRTGTTLWKTSMRAGINACPALASHWLLVGAGMPRRRGDVLELAGFTT